MTSVQLRERGVNVKESAGELQPSRRPSPSKIQLTNEDGVQRLDGQSPIVPSSRCPQPPAVQAVVALQPAARNSVFSLACLCSLTTPSGRCTMVYKSSLPPFWHSYSATNSFSRARTLYRLTRAMVEATVAPMTAYPAAYEVLSSMTGEIR